MPLVEIPLVNQFHGLNRIASPQDLSPAESPDCTDCRNAGRLTGRLGQRLGRYRQAVHTTSLLGLGMLVAAFGRFKVTADTSGDWIASAVAWGGITPNTPSAPVTNVSRSSVTSTVTSAAHGFSVGQTVTVALSSGPANYSNYVGTFVLTAVTTNTFSYTMPAAGSNGVAVGTVTSNYVSGMDTSADVRFCQFKERLYAFNGKNPPQSFDGNRWRKQGIQGGVDLSTGLFTPTITLGGGLTINVTTASLTTNVVTLTAPSHGLSVGRQITVAVSNTAYNGTFVVASVPDANTITYAYTHGDIASAAVVGTITVATSAGIAVTSVAIATNVATVVTTTAHSFKVGQVVVFASSYQPKIVDTGNIFDVANTYTIASVPSSTSFTFARTWPDFATLNITTSQVTVSVGTAVSSVITGSYYYVVTPCNSSRLDANGRGIEGIPSEISAVASPVSQSVVVGGIPTHVDPQVDYWNIYRTTNGGLDSGVSTQDQDFFYLGRVANGTSSYTDTTADSTGWYKLRTNFNRARFNQNIPPTCKGMVEFGDRLFAWGFEPIVGTCTLTPGSAAVSAMGSLPNGVKSCYIRFGGEDKRYEIKAWGSASTVTLDRVYEGVQTTEAPYTIFRNRCEIWFSEYMDGDGWGGDGEERRNLVSLPGDREVTCCFPFQGQLLVFTSTEIWALYGKGPNRFDVKKLTDAACVDAGAVSQDAVIRVGNECHFLSLDGPASIGSVGTYVNVKFPGIQLNTDWLDALTATELALACAGTDGRSVWYSVPSAAAQTLNSKTYRWDRDTEGWFEETEMSPKRFIRQDGTDGQIQYLFYIQGKSIIRPNYGTVDLITYVIGTLAGSITTTSVDTATIPTSNGGCVECYVRFYRAGALLGIRRIISNTSSSITWSSTSTLPGAGTLSLLAGDSYEIGNVGWKWLSKTVEMPGHVCRTSEAHATYIKASSTTILKTDVVNGVEDSIVPVIDCTNAVAEKWDVNSANRTYAARFASRNGAVLSSVMLSQEVEASNV